MTKDSDFLKIALTGEDPQLRAIVTGMLEIEDTNAFTPKKDIFVDNILSMYKKRLQRRMYMKKYMKKWRAQ